MFPGLMMNPRAQLPASSVMNRPYCKECVSVKCQADGSKLHLDFSHGKFCLSSPARLCLAQSWPNRPGSAQAIRHARAKKGPHPLRFCISFRRRPASSLALMFAAALAACAHESAPGRLPQTPGAFREVDPVARRYAAAEMPANGAWWLIFGDPQLNELIRRAEGNNFGIQLAAARLAEARAIQKATAAAQWPIIGLGFNATRQEGPLTNAASSTGTLYVFGANLSYEADLFGRLARASEAASLDSAERADLLRAAQLLVQADIAQTYFHASRAGR
ncbi:MAG: TolC family protein [Acetobacteraceae bacterium]|nr:TolC family protein [Acetobacteraceae bacterium]